MAVDAATSGTMKITLDDVLLLLISSVGLGGRERGAAQKWKLQ